VCSFSSHFTITQRPWDHKCFAETYYIIITSFFFHSPRYLYIFRGTDDVIKEWEKAFHGTVTATPNSYEATVVKAITRNRIAASGNCTRVVLSGLMLDLSDVRRGVGSF
jgi:hypothetical protein